MAFSAIDDGTPLTLEVRLTKRLVTLADTHGIAHPEGVLINLHLPQHELATILNITRQTVNKKLTEWRNQGWEDKWYGRLPLRS